ncbi:MAG: helix-turn-helix domain-containing protein [Gordonia paraffinivorans]
MDPSPPCEPNLKRDSSAPADGTSCDRPAQITPEFATEHTLTPSAVAAIFGVTAKTVSRWAVSGELPCITTPGGHRRFRHADVLALVDDGWDRPV